MIMSHHSFGGSNLREETMKLKKYVWMNDAGEIKETTGELPKGWNKGKLLGAKGLEISDAQAKEWGISGKAQSPKENKCKYDLNNVPCRLCIYC